MKTTKIVSKLGYVFKGALAALLLFATCQAYAEYYLAYSGCSTCRTVRYYHPVRCYHRVSACTRGCCGCYGGCAGGCYHYITSRAPYRHNHYDPYQVSEYQWIDP